MQQLRPYQQHALDQLRAGIKAGNLAQVLMLATGGGKTTVASAIKQGAVAKGNRAFFIVDSLELVDQAALRFMQDGMGVGVIQGNHPMTDYSQPVQVATIQTLRKRWDEIAESLKPGVVVIDECHVLHSAHEAIIEECRSKRIPVIGLSATPFRKGLGKHFESMVVGATTADLIRDGYLCPATCYAPYVPDLKGVKTNASGDWAEDALAEVMGDATLVGDVVDQWLKLAERRQTIVFGTNVAHSRALCDAFLLRGIKAAHIDGYERDRALRTQVVNAYRRGEIQVLCNVAVLTKGFDAPETSCVVFARPTKSLMLHYQMMGRGLRIAPGKADCIIIDHAGNCLRNGLPDDSLPAVLDDGKSERNLDRRERDENEPVSKPCGSCGHVSTKHVCPACGFKPERRQDVEVVDGELYEVKTAKRKRMTTAQLEQFYSELLGYCRMKGYREGWAYHKCQEYVGRAPRSRNNLSAAHPSDDTMRIIKHLQIRAAKRKEAA
ncbi:DEAD/DEAH box helicase [uncultured Halomonas sp.]|uniref:DEAD/DEAH box helicase n=1 Tax=uncultured Halomonas sp. TaxID=173971 RepID=UPI0026307E26|nr:DEAD/DEAH box helicase [uncultured Halomonas sp.]